MSDFDVVRRHLVGSTIACEALGRIKAELERRRVEQERILEIDRELTRENDRLRDLLSREWRYHHTGYDGPVPSEAEVREALGGVIP
jgi:hypothetical protein